MNEKFLYPSHYGPNASPIKADRAPGKIGDDILFGRVHHVTFSAAMRPASE